MVISVRPATLSDLDWLMGQLRSFSRFFASKRPLFEDETYARATFATFIEHHLVLISDGHGVGPTGFIAGLKMPHLFNPKIMTLTEMFWWVDEKYRGTRSGLLLLQAFTNYGKANADWINFTLEDESPVAERSLTRRGYRLKERNFLMEV